MGTAADGSRRHPVLRLLCPKTSILSAPSPSILWLIGSPRFLHPLTIAAALRCLPEDGPFSPTLPHEAGKSLWSSVASTTHGLSDLTIDLVCGVQTKSVDCS
jgi:hypothetical protein